MPVSYHVAVVTHIYPTLYEEKPSKPKAQPRKSHVLTGIVLTVTCLLLAVGLYGAGKLLFRNFFYESYNDGLVLTEYIGSGTHVVIPSKVAEKAVIKINSEVFQGNKSITSVVIPKGVTEIGNGTFRGCSSLTSVVIPEGVTYIGNGAFKGCNSLTSVVIPEGVKIGWEAFSGCSSLTTVVIPKGVTEISENAFKDCPNLTIRTPKGSKAEQYAKEHNILFEELKSEENVVE